MQYFIAGLIGLISGITSGLLGVGGGIVMVPAMTFFLKLDIKMAIGTSLAVIIPTALSGALKHHGLQQVDWKLALSLAPMAMVGAYFGSTWTAVLPSHILKRIFGGVLVMVGMRLLLFSK